MAAATRPPLAILFLVATLHAAYALADPPPFVAIDAFSSCDPSVFPNEKDVEQWGILPRSKFEILGVVCTVEGCHYEEFIPEFPSLNGAGPPWCVDASTNCINGGVPQRANLTRQLEIFDQRIGAWIPDEEWDGWAALEFENWTPIWEENTDPTSWHGLRYQQYSIALVKAEFPSLNETEVVAKAKEEYEEGAVAFMKGVLDHLHQLRPKARFGFYGFPNQYYCTLGCTDGCNCYADPTDGAILGARNDKASAVWDASGALFPSIYITGRYTHEEQTTFVASNVAEAVRLSRGPKRTMPPADVLPFQWSWYHNSIRNGPGKPPFVDGMVPLSDEDLALVFNSSAYAGATGVIMWDCPQSFGRVNKTRDFITSDVGPAAQAAIKAAAECAAASCSGHGRCVSAEGGGTRCECFEGWHGDACSSQSV